MSEEKTFLDELQLDTLPEEERKVLLAYLGEELYAGVLQKVWNDLDLDTQDALGALLRAIEQKPDDESRHVSLAQFLHEHCPTFEEYLQKELEQIRKTYHETLSELE